MRVILEVVAGPAVGRRFPMQNGERARFGKGRTADICFAEDLELADLHFEIEVQPENHWLRDLASGSPTLLNGEPVEQSEFQDGDTISAGLTQLVVSVAGGKRPVTSADTETSEEEQAAPSPPGIDDQVAPTSMPELCKLLELDEPVLAMAEAHANALELVPALEERRLFLEAVRVLAFSLPRRTGVLWAHQCVSEQGVAKTEAEQSALAAALAWAKDPTEKNRQAANEASEAAGKYTPPGWVAMAAFWSDGSLAPPHLPEVPPDPLLGNQAVAAALLLLATQGEPLQADVRYRQILAAGMERLQKS